MPELTKPKAYLTYPDTEETRKALLDWIPSKIHILKKGNKEFRTRRPLPKALYKDLLEDKHVAIFETTEFEWHGKRRKIFDIPGSTRTVILDGEKHIRVRLEADTKDELYLRISRLKGEMAKLGIKEIVCVWDNIGHLTIEKERPKPKQKVEFDQSYLTKQKTLELETYRQD
jgi:hypothetical protein